MSIQPETFLRGRALAEALRAPDVDHRAAIEAFVEPFEETDGLLAATSVVMSLADAFVGTPRGLAEDAVRGLVDAAIAAGYNAEYKARMMEGRM
ncbi:hypothetical protein [Chelatococcus asaccharovorans]|uniref:Uncharacterized protein n=1 Tax=Chelatococcus asaccharovorans TaxID=28210 RepID=A0A2V3TYP8_9HYPH|nr:hypothetical protein [Chelatococcus asaccharovorans]MBS7704802.1 hypothetical protein [Chelatococcus asaccharovorans]PXW54698.1 hypothetical protein C7450_111231 [Chelatococcus asaccharovorans]CAH1650254.1 conserved hypothetical protein [Chelatococcus asaccharovorans]CAH1686791.1 conserved hypothetical protein [Chelatococcus asaccharovorans]